MQGAFAGVLEKRVRKAYRGEREGGGATLSGRGNARGEASASGGRSVAFTNISLISLLADGNWQICDDDKSLYGTRWSEVG